MAGRLLPWTLALLLLAAAGCGPKPPTFENLVVVVVDTLRSDHLPSYGYERETAPFLARLAAEGVQLQGYSVTAWTRPSVATLLTGLHPQRHQAVGRIDALPGETPYLPEILGEAGFAVHGVSANPNVGRKWGFARGYTKFFSWIGFKKVNDGRITTRALAQVAAVKPRTSRFFLYVHYMGPHDPYEPRRPWGSDGPPAGGYLDPQVLIVRDTPPSEEELQQLRDQYDGEIREVDRAIERLVQGLSEQGLLERTLLVVTSDHGEEFGDHGGLLHGRTLHEEILNVPLILWSRDGLPRRRSEKLFYHLDFLPTMLEALDLPAVDGIDGRPRWERAIAGTGQGDRELFAHLDIEGRGALALRTFPYKLIHTNKPPYRRLADLRRDPAERRAEPPRGELAESLFRRLVEHHNQLAETAYEQRKAGLDREDRRSLAALGYLRGNETPEEIEARAVPARLSLRIGLERLANPPAPARAGDRSGS